jgi:RNA polymerase sigma-32 factor
MANNVDSTLSRYITRAHGEPVLTREHELALFRRYLAQDDQAAKSELLRCHLRYVVAIALKYRRYGLPLADLIAEGNFGLVHAVRKFEPERGHRFVTYAAYWIRAYVLNYIIRSWSLVGVGSGALRSKMFFKLRRERVRIMNLVGEGEHADELLAERIGLPKDQVLAMLRRLEGRDISLDTKIYDDSATTLLDTLVASGTDLDEQLAQTQRQDAAQVAVQRALVTLDARERYIVEHRLMADAEDELSLAEIGRRLGVSRERARQLEARAKRKLKTRLRDAAPRFEREWLESAA